MNKLKALLRNDRIAVAVFLAPALFFFALYMIAPIPISAYYSLFRWSGIGEKVFIGLGNWAELVKDPIFWLSFQNNLKLVVVSIGTQLPMALLLAVFLSARTTKLAGFFKTIYFIPLLTSSVAIGVMWRYIYDTNFGLVNVLLRNLGLFSWIQDWLGDPKLALYSVMVAINWRFIPFYMILFLAAIVAIPEELFEAAMIDGARGIQVFRHITLPQLRPTIINAAVLSLVGALKFFDIVFAMTNGGPAHASELMATYMYKRSFTDFRMGYGSTVAVAIFLIAMVISTVFLNSTRRRTARS
ncbi:MAG: sugar ABC transporter permease [Firmicutes bacterium]|nr:sugar ABC transporter permease [Bacillota bacterium]